MNFSDLITQPGLLKAIEELGYEKPTPIQEMAIPKVLAGNDLRASADTGTGKTAAFLLPSLARLDTPSSLPGRGPRILILVPTRELAMQVANESIKYCKYLSRIKTVCIYGGTPYHLQNKQLMRPYEILVATPGRLMDHMQQGKIDFSRLEVFILDEADRMLDMGFIEAVEEIAEAIPKQRQTLMFSATMKGSVLSLSKRLLNNPLELSVESDGDKHDHIEQTLHNVDNLSHKYRLLDELLNDQKMQQAIVFTSTKHQADELCDKLSEDGLDVAVLHGGLKQRERSRTLLRLRQGSIRILVATDVAARGIDVPTITHVINFDLPMSGEDYVHRIGRTGRAGAFGTALSFVSSKEVHLLKRIEKFTGKKLEYHPSSKPHPASSSFSGGRSKFAHQRRRY